jgi:hypothetical protein
MALNIPTIAIIIIGRRGRVCFSVPRSRAIVAVAVADAMVVESLSRESFSEG